jgi:hypothetical protein
MTNTLQIANRALLHLSLSSINSLEAQTTPARVMSEAVNWSISAVLTEGDWVYSTRTATLTASVEETPPDTEYKYAFTLPASVDRLVGVLDTGLNLSEDYRMEGRLIYANLPTLIVRYISHSVELVNIPHRLAELIATHLAASTCLRLTEDGKLQRTLDERYQFLVTAWSASDARQKAPKQLVTDSSSGFISAHKGYGFI